MNVRISSSGSFDNTYSFLEKMIRSDIRSRLTPYAEQGVAVLASATPKDSMLTSECWTYEIVEDSGSVAIWWVNTNAVGGFNVAIGLQYGHATGTGGYVSGQDYINPAIKPIMDELTEKIWKEVQSA